MVFEAYWIVLDRTVQCNTTYYIPPSYCTNCPIFPILLCRRRAQRLPTLELLVAPRGGSMLLAMPIYSGLGVHCSLFRYWAC